MEEIINRLEDLIKEYKNEIRLIDEVPDEAQYAELEANIRKEMYQEFIDQVEDILCWYD